VPDKSLEDTPIKRVSTKNLEILKLVPYSFHPVLFSDRNVVVDCPVDPLSEKTTSGASTPSGMYAQNRNPLGAVISFIVRLHTTEGVIPPVVPGQKLARRERPICAVSLVLKEYDATLFAPKSAYWSACPNAFVNKEIIVSTAMEKHKRNLLLFITFSNHI
jgi:hypothetical protein